jgi:regulator of sigma E protease
MIVFTVIVGLVILILAHEAGHFFAAKVFGIKVEEFGFGFPPRLFGKKRGETLVSVNALPLGGFVKIYGEDEEVMEERERSFTAKAVWKRIVVVGAGVLMNLIAAWLLLSAVFMIGMPQRLVIADVVSGSPADAAGLKTGDIISSAVFGAATLSDPVAGEAFIDLVKNAGGNTVSLTILRGKEALDVSLAPRTNPPEGEGPLGIGLVGVGFSREPFFRSVKDGFVMSTSIFFLSFKAFGVFFISLFSSPEIIKTVSGPVGIFAIANQTGSLGFVYLLELIALISVNLAALNLLPIPALDGGRIVFLIIEKLKGSPVSYVVQRIVNASGFAMLLLLMVLVTFKDVGVLFN